MIYFLYSDLDIFIAMFLQRYRKSNQKEFLSPPQDLSSLKLSELLKKMSPNEIRQHQKKNVYLNPRTYLI